MASVQPKYHEILLRLADAGVDVAVDTSAFAFIDMALAFPGGGALRGRTAQHENLVAYRKRVRETYWSDLG